MKINTNLYGVIVKNHGKWARKVYYGELDSSLSFMKEGLEDIRKRSKRSKNDIKLVKMVLETVEC